MTSVEVAAPEGVAVYVEGRRVPLQGGRMTFAVPDVTEGKQYAYHFRAERARDGRVEVQQRQVTFRAGERVRVDFTQPDPAAVSRR